MQAIRGQAEMWQATRPIDAVLADPMAPQGLKHRLEQAMRIREFASKTLALPDNSSYRGYADLKRPYVVWNVFAADPLSIKPRQWCFPIAGCVAYKGYFSRAQAEAHAEELRRNGDDVFLGGVPAYSTLGYFSDPVLNTFIHYPQAELARLIFHELAHQVAYATDDTAFNESFAVTVEREGVRRWMERYGSPAELEAFHQAQERRSSFYAIAGKYRRRLEGLYRSGLPADEMLARKQAVFAELAAEYQALKASWGGFRGYDPWLGAGANNASLASVAVYTHLVPAFQRLLETSGNDLPRFYAAARRLAELPKAEREARLKELRASVRAAAQR
ncbi:MAG: aminopeptidase [Burkholderiales bacterium]|nr:aminopeptidase [Burkholderiales bacterium]